MLNDHTPNLYDEVPYPGYPFAQTHPDRLSTLATIFGLRPAPVTRCRVLELGCGDGANLIPMAFSLPESEFTGVDLAAQPVAAGRARAAELELHNLELRCLDLCAVDRGFGEFDYIIAHGVYSWVPPEVRERMLAICRELLAPHGVAYISYNALPGCHLRQMVREMMRFHVRELSDPRERVEQGLMLLRILLQKFPGPQAAERDMYGSLLKEQLEDMQGWRRRETIYHDDLAEINDPVYFHEFMAQARRHGLQYLAEANFFEMQDYIYPPPLREFLRRFSPAQIIEKEQYLDFLKCRSFRQTLLCRSEAQLRRDLNPQWVRELLIESPAQPVTSPPDLRPGVVQEFRGLRGAKLQTDDPLARAALWHLGQIAPRALSWSELLTAVRERLAADALPEADGAEQILAEILLAAYGAGLVQLHVWQPHFVTIVSARPQASRLARWQAARGESVTSLLHQTVEPDDVLSRHLMQLLDGTRDHARLCDDLVAALSGKQPVTLPDGTELSDPAALRQLIADGLAGNLQKCAQMALLVK